MVSSKVSKLAGALTGSSTIATQAAANAQRVIAQQQKAQSFASKNAKDINNNAILPNKERSALAKIVDEAVTLSAPVVLQDVTLTSAGKFEITLQLDPNFALGSKSTTAKQKAAIVSAIKAKVTSLIGKHGAWEKPTGAMMTFASVNTYQFLVGASAPSTPFMENFGQSKLSVSGITAKLLAGAEKLVADAAQGKNAVLAIGTINQALRNASGGVAAIMRQVVTQIGGSFNGLPLANGRSYSYSQSIITFIKGWESYVPVAQIDGAGKSCTIGYGHALYAGKCTGASALEKKYPAPVGMPVQAAETLLTADVALRESTLKNYLAKSKITQEMYDALLSLYFNAGAGPNKAPRLWSFLNDGLYYKAALEFLDIDLDTATGLKVPGLTKRRSAENDIFLKGNYSGRP